MIVVPMAHRFAANRRISASPISGMSAFARLMLQCWQAMLQRAVT